MEKTAKCVVRVYTDYLIATVKAAIMVVICIVCVVIIGEICIWAESTEAKALGIAWFAGAENFLLASWQLIGGCILLTLFGCAILLWLDGYQSGAIGMGAWLVLTPLFVYLVALIQSAYNLSGFSVGIIGFIYVMFVLIPISIIADKCFPASRTENEEREFRSRG